MISHECQTEYSEEKMKCCQLSKIMSIEPRMQEVRKKPNASTSSHCLIISQYNIFYLHSDTVPQKTNSLQFAESLYT